ncbi:MAG TPA: hypothetical protein VLM79_33950 [Kofleriaceae bacterium]|nr:hypothetical protein [Kofleriaceae bacterium]
MTSRTSTHPSFLSPHGSDPELSIPSALAEDELTVLTVVRRTSDVYALQIVDDATPEAIDDEPTVPIHFRRTGSLRAVHPRPLR